VPHPHIEVRQRSEVELQFLHPLRLELDGEAWMSASSVRIVVLPDALTVVV
jgi:diacylglycerol kinase family enzyme